MAPASAEQPSAGFFAEQDRVGEVHAQQIGARFGIVFEARLIAAHHARRQDDGIESVEGGGGLIECGGEAFGPTQITERRQDSALRAPDLEVLGRLPERHRIAA